MPGSLTMSSPTPVAMRSLLRAILDERRGLDLRAFDERTLRHAVDVGLGPLLYELARDGTPHPWQALLRAQDLAARVESLNRLDALEAILAAAPPLAGKVMLLKGMSLCLRLYPQSHWRMMGDIDLLVKPSLQRTLEDALYGLGYERWSPQLPAFYDQHHHSMPFRHPQSGIIVEVHSGLFRPQSPLGKVSLFQAEPLLARAQAGQFRKFTVLHLDAETELAYLATHWINERRCFGTAVIPMVDLALRLRRLPDGFDWQRLFNGMAGSAAAPLVRVALTYLHNRIGVPLPAEVVERLGQLSARPSAGVDRWLHRLIDRHALAGRPFGPVWTRSQANVVWEALLAPRAAVLNLLTVPWSMLFPPGQARRFHPGFHWQRLRSAFRRWTNNIK